MPDILDWSDNLEHKDTHFQEKQGSHEVLIHIPILVYHTPTATAGVPV